MKATQETLHTTVLVIALGIALAVVTIAVIGCDTQANANEAPKVEEKHECECEKSCCEPVESDEEVFIGTYCPKVNKAGKRYHSRGHFKGKDGRDMAICFTLSQVCKPHDGH